jgi:hypothetical protein
MEGSKAPTNPATLAVELAGHAYVWGQAVGLEAERVRSAATVAERHIDCYLLVLAIRQVLRSAEAMDRAIGGDEELRKAQTPISGRTPPDPEDAGCAQPFRRIRGWKGAASEVG